MYPKIGRGYSVVDVLAPILVVSLFILSILPVKVYAGSDVKKNDNNDNTEKADKVVVRVNGVPIMESEVERETTYLIPRTVMHREIRERTKEKLRRKAIERLIEDELIYQEAKALGIEPDRKDVKDAIKRLKKRLKGRGTSLKEELKKEGHDMKWLERYLGRESVILKRKIQMQKKLRKDVRAIVTEDFMKRYYYDNKDKFVKPEAYRLREILIKVDPSSPQEKWDEAKKKAQEIIDRLKKGEDFAKLAEEFSDDEYAKKGGDMGIIHRGGLMGELERVVEKLKVGEVGGPIWSLYGFHVVKLEDKIPAVQKSYEEVKARLKKTLKRTEYKRLWNKWLQGLRTKANIEYLEKEGKGQEEAQQQGGK